MNHPRYELYNDKAGEFRFRLTAKNGQTILSASEGYNSKSGAKNGIESVKKNSQVEDHFDKRSSDSGKHSFILKAGNNQVIARSQSYNSRSGMDNGIHSVMENADKADVLDQTA